MIDINRINFDDRVLNFKKGLAFYFENHGHIISFLIDVIGDRKKMVKVTMHPDINHHRPHVHLDRHDASFAIDSGELLTGECDNKTQKIMKIWIERHREDLLDLWDIAKRGDDYRPQDERLRYNFKTIICGVGIWHNGELFTERNEDGTMTIVSLGDMLVVLPLGFRHCSISFKSVDGKIKYRDRC